VLWNACPQCWCRSTVDADPPARPSTAEHPSNTLTAAAYRHRCGLLSLIKLEAPTALVMSSCRQTCMQTPSSSPAWRAAGLWHLQAAKSVQMSTSCSRSRLAAAPPTRRSVTA
jgi:hypothetical protein